MANGELAIVLHTHMPYVEGGGSWPPAGISEYMAAHDVDFGTAARAASFEPNLEGFGTWPFGEEWLWEAAATSYVPLLRLLDQIQHSRERLTLSLTPVLCDQLEAPGAMERCIAFLRTVRAETHRLEVEEFERRGESGLVSELERSAAEYAAAADTLEALQAERTDKTDQPHHPDLRDYPDRCDDPDHRHHPHQPGGLARALGRHASWTSSATHAVLPLLALEESLELQLRVGIESHRRRSGDWDGGFWLPECAHAPWLHGPLAETGVHVTCVELTGVFGCGDGRNLRPLRPADGPTLVPIDRAVIDLVWGQGGYPSHPAYRDSHRRTRYRHQPWANDGSIYDAVRARRQASADARDFIQAVRERVATGGLCVCALDTELLGHWWYEGPLWLAAVIAEAERQGLALTAIDPAAIERQGVTPTALELPPSSWGAGGDLHTWSAPAVADLAWQARAGELRSFHDRGAGPSPRALRELLALQSSDWAFLASRGWAGDYPRQRASGHAAQLARALRGEALQPNLRNLATYLKPGYS